MDAHEETKEQLLIRRVFNLIAESHFQDHKMIPHYCNQVHFPRGLGDDISNYVQAKNPTCYHTSRRRIEAENKNLVA